MYSSDVISTDLVMTLLVASLIDGLCFYTIQDEQLVAWPFSSSPLLVSPPRAHENTFEGFHPLAAQSGED